MPDRRTSSPSAVRKPPPSITRANPTTRDPAAGHSGALTALRLAAVDSAAAATVIHTEATANNRRCHAEALFGSTLMDGATIRQCSAFCQSIGLVLAVRGAAPYALQGDVRCLVVAP